VASCEKKGRVGSWADRPADKQDAKTEKREGGGNWAHARGLGGAGGGGGGAHTGGGKEEKAKTRYA